MGANLSIRQLSCQTIICSNDHMVITVMTYESTDVYVCMSISIKRFAQLVFVLPYHNIIYLRCSSTISKHQTEC